MTLTLQGEMCNEQSGERSAFTQRTPLGSWIQVGHPAVAEILAVAAEAVAVAVENIDEIVSVEGVDGVFTGPYDLSGSYGCVGQLGHPDVVGAHSAPQTARDAST